MNAEQRAANSALLKRLVVVVVAMFGFGFALVPIYEQICEVTGIRNVAKADEVGNTQVDTTRSVRVELVANTRKLPWQFEPREREVKVHPGELKQVVYEVVNTTDRPVTGQAITSYAPSSAAQYFRKQECFCFATQTLAAGEEKVMPVVFVVSRGAGRHDDDLALVHVLREPGGAASRWLRSHFGFRKKGYDKDASTRRRSSRRLVRRSSSLPQALSHRSRNDRRLRESVATPWRLTSPALAAWRSGLISVGGGPWMVGGRLRRWRSSSTCSSAGSAR